MHVGSSSPTRDQTWAPCIGSAESYPLDHKGSPITLSTFKNYWELQKTFADVAHIFFFFLTILVIKTEKFIKFTDSLKTTVNSLYSNINFFLKKLDFTPK